MNIQKSAKKIEYAEITILIDENELEDLKFLSSKITIINESGNKVDLDVLAFNV